MSAMAPNFAISSGKAINKRLSTRSLITELYEKISCIGESVNSTIAATKAEATPSPNIPNKNPFSLFS